MGESNSERSFELVKEIGDSLVPGLKLTKDFPEYHPNGKCPILDIQVWLEEKQGFKRIRHTYPRQDCAPCQGRRILGVEEEEEDLKKADGESKTRKKLGNN